MELDKHKHQPIDNDNVAYACTTCGTCSKTIDPLKDKCVCTYLLCPSLLEAENMHLMLSCVSGKNFGSLMNLLMPH